MKASITLSAGIIASLGGSLLYLFQRKGAPRQWRRSERERQYHVMVDSIQDYAIFMLYPDGTVATWNKGAEHVEGYQSSEIVGRPYFTLFTGEDRLRRVPQAMMESATRNGRVEVEQWRRRKDGSEFCANIVLTAIRDPNGRLAGYTQVTRDLTERRRQQEELERRVLERTREVEEANQKLAGANSTLEAFASSVSHDVRAPLRAIHGLAVALQEDFGEQLGPTGTMYAEKIVHSAKGLDRLIEDLLALSCMDRMSIELGSISLRQAVNNAISHLSEDIEQSGARINAEHVEGSVCASAPVLLQIISNLLSNALKFTAAGVRPDIIIRTQRLNGRIRLWVEDKGIGVAPEHQEKIFGVFERLHGSEKYEGTGIGLAIVRHGAERLGGQAGIVSQPGQGSRFWIELNSASEMRTLNAA